MPRWGYSLSDYDPTTTVIASGRDVPVSFKKSVNVCREIKGMALDRAKEYLKSVTKLESPVAFTTYRKKVAHRSSLGGRKGASGRYPVKAARAILKVLENAESNALQKGLSPETLVVYHAAAQKSRVVERLYPRAFGRMSLKRRILTHIEIGLKSVSR